ncbi:MAG: hypothetical protein ABIP72_07725 [Acidimicrobiales bacterium]
MTPESAAAELSSMATAVDELTRRVTGLADAFLRAKRDDVAGELYKAERALIGARRSLDRVVGWGR